MSIVDELIAVLGFKLTGEEDAKRFEDRIDRMGKGLDNFARKAGRFTAAAGVLVGTGLGILGRSVVNTSAQFETFAATLETIEGSAEKAQESLDWIAEFGKTTPYDVAQVTDSFVKLKAYGIDPIADDALRTLGDTAAAMGKPLNQAVEAFADAATGEFERLKEFGIKAKTEGDNVTFAWTENGQELTKTVKKSSEEIRGFLLQTMGDRFAGAMDRQSRTWTGMMSNLGDTWTDFQRRIGEAGFFDNVSDKLARLLDWLNKLDKDGTLDRWAQNLSDVLSTSADIIEKVVTQAARHIAFLSEKFAGMETILLVIAGVIAAFAAPWITAFAAILLVVDDFLTYLQGGESVIGTIIEGWKRIFTEFPGWLKQIFVDLKDSMIQLGYDMGNALLEGLKSIGQAIKDWFASLVPDWARDLVGGERTTNTRPIASTRRGGATGFGGSENQSGGLGSLTNNLQGNLDRLGRGANLTDNRQQNMTQTVTINQNVQQATDAPGAVAEATGRAAIAASRKRRTQTEAEPSF